MGDCAGSRSVGRARKRWIDSVKEYLKKRLDIRQARRLVQDRSEWRGFMRGGCMGRSPGDKPLTSMRCHSYMKPFKSRSPSVVEPTTYRV